MKFQPLSLSGIILPSYLIESYQCKVCGVNGTYWVQVKTEKGRREEAYHLKGDIKHIPERLVLRDLPTPPQAMMNIIHLTNGF